MIHVQDQERRKVDAKSGTSTGSGESYTVPAREMGTQTAESDALASGSNPSYVSLG